MTLCISYYIFILTVLYSRSKYSDTIYILINSNYILSTYLLHAIYVLELSILHSSLIIEMFFK